MIFLNKDPSDESINWSEDMIQCYIVQQSRKAGYDVAASMEQGKRSPAGASRAKAMGMVAGEPDLRYYLPNGNLIMIELKNKNGKLNPAQKERIPKLQGLGYRVHVVNGKTPVDGWEKVKNIIKMESI